MLGLGIKVTLEAMQLTVAAQVKLCSACFTAASQNPISKTQMWNITRVGIHGSPLGVPTEMSTSSFQTNSNEVTAEGTIVSSSIETFELPTHHEYMNHPYDP
jgi:hypothetical protein